jgi:hypothetical protein
VRAHRAAHLPEAYKSNFRHIRALSKRLNRKFNDAPSKIFAQKRGAFF